MATANISNRISLDGGDDLRQQVFALADELNKLFKGVHDVADQFGRIDASKLSSTQSQLAGTSQAAGQAQAQVEGFGTELLSFAGKASLGIGALALAVGGIISSIASSAATATSALQESAQKFGLTVQTYQALKQGADDAGISVEGLNRILGTIDRAATQAGGSISRVIPTDTAGRFAATGASLQQIAGGLAVAQQSVDAFGRTAGQSIDLIQKFGDNTVKIFNGVSQSSFDLAKNTDNVRQGAKAAAGALTDLGISAQLLSQLTPDQRLQLIAIQLDKIPDGAAKASVAAKLFGDEWRKALEFIKALPSTLADSDGSLRTFSDSEIASGKKLKDALAELSAAFSFLKDKIGLLFAAGQTARAEWLTKLIDDARKLLFGFIAADDAKKKLLDSGQFDFFKDLDLDKFKDFLDQKGESGLAQAIGLIRDISRDLALVWSNVLIPAGQVIIAAFNGVAEQINAAFGSDISGRFVAIVTVIGLLTGAFGTLRAVFSPVVALFGFVLSSIGSLGPLLLAGGLAVRAFWTEFRAGGSAAVNAVRAESAGFLAAFAQLARGNFSGAWALFKSAALDAFATTKDALGKIFGGEGSAVFTNITRLISGVALVASGLAAIFNAIFGTNLNAEGLLLIAVLAQLTGAFGLLRAAGLVLAVVLTPVGAAFTAITAAAIILARQFPDLGKSWESVKQAFTSLLAGDFGKAFESFGQAFEGVWSNLKDQGVLTWSILGAGAIALGAAVNSAAGAVGTLLSNLKKVAVFLAPLIEPLVALGTLTGLIQDVTHDIDPLQKKIEDINKAFASGQIDLDEYNKRLKALGDTGTEATGKNVATTNSFADSWKAALDQIKGDLSQIGATGKQAADSIVPPFNQAADKIADAFKKAADFNGFRNVAQGVWQQIGDDGKTASERLAGSFNNAAQNSFNGFREVAKGVWQKIPQDAKAAGDAVKQTVDEQWKAIADTVTQSLATMRSAFEALSFPDGVARDLSTLQQAFQTLGQSSQDLSGRINDAFTALQSDGSTAASQLQTVAASVQGLGPVIEEAAANAGGLGQAFDGVASSATSGISSASNSLDGLIGKLSEAASAAQETATAIASLGIADNGGLPAVPFAAGGFTGAGGVWEPAGVVHRGEYVQPAHVVRQPGVLAFMEMLRSFGGDLRAVFANFGLMPRGFSVGGLVDSLSRQLAFEPPRLAYAGGGLVNAPASAGALHPVTIDMGGGRSIGGLFAPPDPVRQLQKAALFDRLRSSRVPSRGSKGG
jgi:hypothetical protein